MAETVEKCALCSGVHFTSEAVLECSEKYEREAARDRARKYARTGVSQIKRSEKPEVKP